jgi:hypothetical protein
MSVDFMAHARDEDDAWGVQAKLSIDQSLHPVSGAVLVLPFVELADPSSVDAHHAGELARRAE